MKDFYVNIERFNSEITTEMNIDYHLSTLFCLIAINRSISTNINKANHYQIYWQPVHRFWSYYKQTGR